MTHVQIQSQCRQQLSESWELNMLVSVVQIGKLRPRKKRRIEPE